MDQPDVEFPHVESFDVFLVKVNDIPVRKAAVSADRQKEVPLPLREGIGGNQAVVRAVKVFYKEKLRGNFPPEALFSFDPTL
jgi:hypothetical protein